MTIDESVCAWDEPTIIDDTLRIATARKKSELDKLCSHRFVAKRLVMADYYLRAQTPRGGAFRDRIVTRARGRHPHEVNANAFVEKHIKSVTWIERR
jgi:hypothetical protein